MPILEVEIVVNPGEILPAGLAAEIAERAGDIFGSAAGGTWVRIYPLPRENYAENGGSLDDTIRPVFVSILKAQLPPADILRDEVCRVTEAIAKACGRPAENVHIVYQPEGKGRVAFGGRIVE